MISPEIHSLDKSQTEQLLDHLHGWRSGICPDGKLAKIPSFVLGQMPNIVIHPDTQHLFTTEIITEYEWAENLLNCGAINHLDDGIMMKTLADFYMIFHEKTDKTSRSNTVHLIQLRKHASFKVDHVFRPTRSLQLELDSLFKKTQILEQWNHLLKIWSTFGFLWPRRIVVGYKTHVKETYSFKDDVEGMHAYYHHSGTVKNKLQSVQELAPFDLDQFLTEGVIVSRLDLAPLHDFLEPTMKQRIQHIIQNMFVRIPMYYPIKIYNVLTKSYLCWDPKKKSQPDTIFKGQTLDYIVRSVSADPEELNQSPESQYLWRLSWYPLSENTEPFDHHSQTVRGGDKVYIYPACRTQHSSANQKFTPSATHHWPIHDRGMNAPNYVDTYKMVLSCCPHRYESEPPSLSKLKGLRLLSSQSPYYANEKIDWTLEHPNSRLKYMSDAAMNLKLNIHEYLRRTRPILEGSTIHLQQIGLLTAFVPDASSSPPSSFEFEESPVQSLRTAKKITQHSKSKFHKNNVLCVDEDITNKRFAYNTLWRIELATRFDMDRHSSNFFRWPQSNKLGYPIDYHPILSQDVSEHYSTFLNKETGSLMSMATTNSSLRRSKSLGSLQDNNKPKFNTRPSSDKARYYEDLVNTKGKSKMISHLVKRVSLQPLTQLVKPTRNKQSQQLSPPPFSHQPA